MATQISFHDVILSAHDAQRRAHRQISKTAKALAARAFDSVDVDDVLLYDECEVDDLRDVLQRDYARAAT